MIASVTLNPAIDHTLRISDSLEDGTVTRTDQFTYDAGGKGINVSKYLKALGVATTATGVSGGTFGSYLLATLEKSGLETEFVEYDRQTRLNTTILGPTEEYKINQTGPQLRKDAVEQIIDILRAITPETIVIAGSLPPGATAATIDTIAEAGPWESVVDVTGSVLSSLESQYTLCKPNREELAEATGSRVRTREEAINAAQNLHRQGFDRVIASLGGDGAIMVTADDVVHAPARDVEVVDTVGAGDGLLAGVLAAQSRGESPRESLVTGIAVASRVVSTPGTSVPSFETIQTGCEGIGVSTD